MNIGIKIRGINNVCEELRNIIALSKELESRARNLEEYCTFVDIEMTEYNEETAENLAPKPIEESIDHAIEKVFHSSKLYEKVNI